MYPFAAALDVLEFLEGDLAYECARGSIRVNGSFLAFLVRVTYVIRETS
jgi:hypothetical protein